MPVVMLLCKLHELWLCPLPHDRRHSSRSESRFFFKLLYGRSILSLFCAISDPSDGACGGSELSDSEGLMKQPALLGPVAAEDVGFAADGGLIRYLTVPKAILDALLLPPPPVVCCVAWVCVCVDVEATIVVVDDPLPVPPEVEASGLTIIGAAVSSPVGGFMAISQSVRCGGKFRLRDSVWGLPVVVVCFGSFSVPVGLGLLVRLLIEVRSGGILGALRTAGSSRKPAFCVRFSVESRVGLAGIFRGQSYPGVTYKMSIFARENIQLLIAAGR